MSDMKKEYTEAINAGEYVLLEANEILKLLDSARNWGVLDMFSRGGFISAMVKHSKLDDAQHEMNRLRGYLETFNHELDDIRVFERIDDIRMDDFMRFADFFLDNPFVDFMALSRISESKRQVQDLKYRVEMILDNLYRKQEVLFG